MSANDGCSNREKRGKYMQDANIIHISIEEGEKAFRINGVTLAKRHLLATMTKGDDLEKKLARYLAIVPFLATAYEVKDNAPESIKYGAAKAKRLYKALELTEEATLPFMLVCMAQAGEDVRSIGLQVKEAGFDESGKYIRPFQSGEQEENLLFPGNKPTLH